MAATKELQVNITWLNNDSFEMVRKKKGTTGSWSTTKTIVKVEENGFLKELRPSLEKTCNAYFIAKIKEIWDEMEE